MRKKKRNKICLISSSGGHYEQLKMLASLEKENDVFWVTEKVNYTSNADYYLYQTGMRDKLFFVKMLLNLLKSIKIWFTEKPDYVITTGAMVVLPMAFLAKIMGRKLVYIETYARVRGGTRSGKLMYKFADLFIIQWEPLKEVYPDAVYGGSIY
ncbi:PssD/Cps14F family polysaccharide biosynthesis glycosyltransferase [Oceanobacillus alkalisoli]|uniref:PssD/Cps14F family polysaccharide biosynthesis glycosyltransferase n=1 Tax=Oceanobacillus alkalisoli TaxID=2925113 RepID=UPI001EE3BDF3|nr:PssD/Cps14F family polysaccharide biosynthesis glycosyltransferase [Oceanobacillus alkalisoli]MCG5102607.1 polysaccharide biosynthesis protein [Oceanobacillus alkalisoli]